MRKEELHCTVAAYFSWNFLLSEQVKKANAPLLSPKKKETKNKNKEKKEEKKKENHYISLV